MSICLSEALNLHLSLLGLDVPLFEAETLKGLLGHEGPTQITSLS